MPILIERPTIIAAAGSKPKRIEEFDDRVIDVEKDIHSCAPRVLSWTSRHGRVVPQLGLRRSNAHHRSRISFAFASRSRSSLFTVAKAATS
jgi:hypothetical protein